MRRISRYLPLYLLALAALSACDDVRTEPDAKPIVLGFPEVEKPRDADGKVTLKDWAAAVPDDDPDLSPLGPAVIVKMLLVEEDPDRIAFALQMLDDPDIGSRRLDTWRANGFRFGVIDGSRLPLFLGNLPKPVYNKVSTFHAALNYAPLTLVDKVNGRARVKIAEADGSTNLRRFSGGEYQLLLKTPPTPGGQPRLLDLVPHHHAPLRSLMLRTPDERVMDGDSFQQLRVYRALRPGETWVLTADPAREPSKPDTEEAPTRKPPGEETQPLAQAMLTGNSQGKKVQIVLLIWLEEEEGEAKVKDDQGIAK